MRVKSPIIYTKDYFKNLGKGQFGIWLKSHQQEFLTSSLFTYKNNLLGKIVRKLSYKYTYNSFIPTHVGQIFIEDSKMYLFNMAPPRGQIMNLLEYVYNVDFDWEIITYTIEDLEYSKYISDIKSFDNTKYGYFSAIQSGIKCLKWIPNKHYHCSEIQGLILQNQGYFKDIKVDDLTPIEIYNLLLYNKTNIKL